MTSSQILALPVVILTFVGVARGEYPGMSMNRATIALVGAVALIVLQVIPLHVALASLDGDTLLLLFAMMIINVHLRMSGFFTWVGRYIVFHARSPRILLAWIVIVSGLLSALFLNDTVVLILAPLVVEVVRALKRNSLPYLIALAVAANIGSVATITGNPQNMLIGMSSHLSFVTFTLALLPVAMIGLLIEWLIIVRVYRGEFNADRFEVPIDSLVAIDVRLLRKSLVLTFGMVVAFLIGVPIPLAALAAAAGLLVTRRNKPDVIFAQVDWSLLVFFSGLFIVTGALSYSHWSDELFKIIEPIARGGVLPLAVTTATLSNIISNVPAVMLFQPLVPHFVDPNRTWLTLAMASTLAGNLTLLGSVANLIVVESARGQGIQISFKEYLKVGVPITLLTLVVGIVWLSLT